MLFIRCVGRRDGMENRDFVVLLFRSMLRLEERVCFFLARRLTIVQIEMRRTRSACAIAFSEKEECGEQTSVFWISRAKCEMCV